MPCRGGAWTVRSTARRRRGGFFVQFVQEGGLGWRAGPGWGEERVITVMLFVKWLPPEWVQWKEL